MEIRKYITLFLIASAFASLVLSCKKDGGDSAIAERPVVVSYLVAGEPITMKVYLQKGILDTAAYGAPVSGLSITLSNGSKQLKLSELTKGVYTSDDLSLVTPNSICSMSFDYNGNTVSAETKVPSLPVNFKASSLEQAVPDPDPLDSVVKTFYPVTFNWTATSGGYYLLVFRNQDSTPLRIGNGFGRHNPYSDMEEYLGQVSSFTTQPMTFMFSGYYDTYLYHINAEYNEILNSSGTSSLNLTNPATNIKNGLGIFTAMSKTSLLFHVYTQ
ncbi:DUF4249 family protein [Pedobacter duraquae]|uniref:Uncharacterized protein DUF4249 n=1 Tax=Pedobacter duraquae TaxID=425511 RepID=A0A4R6IK93_9SPHI|nr:DUF4249 family protein [Pedobacter duraquae]TDO22441.1 uncharacterized protein DUF4249 [Pedobacter duraquae]